MVRGGSVLLQGRSLNGRWLTDFPVTVVGVCWVYHGELVVCVMVLSVGHMFAFGGGVVMICGPVVSVVSPVLVSL